MAKKAQDTCQKESDRPLRRTLLSDQCLEFYGLIPVLHGDCGVRVKGFCLKRSEAVKHVAALDDVQTHSVIRGEDSQDDVISCDNISERAGRVFSVFNECTNVRCEVTQLVKIVHGVLQRNQLLES